LFIQCPKCAEKYHQSCSPQCADFLQLPEKERFEKRKTMIFKGSVAGKGRFNPADL
jgi:predicted nucleic acid-binding Zn ribbon protein